MINFSFKFHATHQNYKRIKYLILLLATIIFTFSVKCQKPNIVIIYADDLGYGDVGCYNPESKVSTPNIDRMASEGMRFTDAHSPSTVCTPSRYGIMTGRMPFRLNYKGVFEGVEGPCLISRDRLTLPEMLQQKGYSTAMFGKWHIGMTFLDKNGKPVYETSNKTGVELVQQVDFSRPIQDGPLNHGFDQFFGTVCCPTTDWLYAYVDGDVIPNPPARVRDRSHIPVTPFSKNFREGVIASDFDLEEVDMVFLEKSKDFITNHVKNKGNEPFFLFHSAQAVHLPSIPGKAFKGKTKVGVHGDFIFEFDYIVGEIIKTLKNLGIEDNTLVIVSSDNGPEVTTSCNMRSLYEHDGARPWRGVKRDQWEGGHRVPFIVKWPGKIKKGSISDQTICQTDMMHTCAAITGFVLPDDAAEDSYNILPAFYGKDKGESIRPYTLHQTIKQELAIRKGKWKYLDHKGSGGNNYKSRKCLQDYHNIIDNSPEAPGQLYNLEDDPGETKNLYYKHPEVVKELMSLLEESKRTGRSR